MWGQYGRGRNELLDQVDYVDRFGFFRIALTDAFRPAQREMGDEGVNNFFAENWKQSHGSLSDKVNVQR